MKKYLFLIMVISIIISCDDKNNETSFITSLVSENYSSIADPLERWQAYGLTNYSIEESRTCECFPPNSCTAYIVGNEVLDVDYELSEQGYYGRTREEIYSYTKNFAMTIDDAFSLIEKYRATAHKIETEYDPRFGFPSTIYIDIDSLMADEEIHREFKNLKRLIK